MIKALYCLPHLTSNLTVFLLPDDLSFEIDNHSVPAFLAFFKLLLLILLKEWGISALYILQFSLELNPTHEETILALWINSNFPFNLFTVELFKLFLGVCEIPDSVADLFDLFNHNFCIFVHHFKQLIIAKLIIFTLFKAFLHLSRYWFDRQLPLYFIARINFLYLFTTKGNVKGAGFAIFNPRLVDKQVPRRDLTVILTKILPWLMDGLLLHSLSKNIEL